MDIPLKLSDKLCAYNLHVSSKSARYSFVISINLLLYSLRFLGNLNEKKIREISYSISEYRHLFITDSSFGPRNVKNQSKCHEFALSRGMNDLTHWPLSRPQIQVPSTAYDFISFNGQGQLYPLTCAG